MVRGGGEELGVSGTGSSTSRMLHDGAIPSDVCFSVWSDHARPYGAARSWPPCTALSFFPRKVYRARVHAASGHAG